MCATPFRTFLKNHPLFLQRQVLEVFHLFHVVLTTHTRVSQFLKHEVHYKVICFSTNERLNTSKHSRTKSIHNCGWVLLPTYACALWACSEWGHIASRIFKRTYIHRSRSWIASSWSRSLFWAVLFREMWKSGSSVQGYHSATLRGAGVKIGRGRIFRERSERKNFYQNRPLRFWKALQCSKSRWHWAYSPYGRTHP